MADWYYYTATGGEATISTPLAGNVVTMLFRDGTNYRKVTGTPAGKQFKFNFSGVISFPASFPSLAPGEQVDIRVANDIE